MMKIDWTKLETLPLLDRAIAFAVMKHSGQFRKGTGLPYITHAVEAMEIVSRMTEDEEIRAAAVLHDTLEDTETTKEELVRLFGWRVAKLVESESEDKREDRPAEETWWIRKKETIWHLAHASTEIRMLALGDKLSNIRAMHRDYQMLGEKLWSRFNQKDPIMHGMYYGLLANAFGEDETLRETQAYREYVDLCSELFSREYDGDGNLIEENDTHKYAENKVIQEGEKADPVKENYAAMPEESGKLPLYFVWTEDPDLLEIQKMAATLGAILRKQGVGFSNVCMHFANDPFSNDVSWQRREDGYTLHLCVENGKCWDQAAFQLGYLMTHCLIDHLGGKNQEGISWAEELVCEAATLYLMYTLYTIWEETPFGTEDPGYKNAIRDYLSDNLNDKGTSALKKCTNRDGLAAINERNCFDDRLEESHELYWAMNEGDLPRLVKIREYEADGLLLYTHYWRAFADGSRAVEYLCRLQERIEGCELPAGISQTIELYRSKPDATLAGTYGELIHSLRALPCEYIIFSFLGTDKGAKNKPGLAFYQVTRERDGRIDAEMRLDSREGRRMYRWYMDDQQAVDILNQILQEGRTPDTKGWEDITDEVFPDGDQEFRPEEYDMDDPYDDDAYNDLDEWEIVERILHPNGRDDD